MFGDTVTSISQSLPMDFAQGIQEITEGIQNAGSIAQQTGVDMQWFSSMIGAVAVQSGKSGLIGSL